MPCWPTATSNPTQPRWAYLESPVTAYSRLYDLMLCTTLDSSIPLGDNKERDTDRAFRILADHYVNQVLHDMCLPHELLPSDGHDQVLARARAFVTARLAGQQRPGASP